MFWHKWDEDWDRTFVQIVGDRSVDFRERLVRAKALGMPPSYEFFKRVSGALLGGGVGVILGFLIVAPDAPGWIAVAALAPGAACLVYAVRRAHSVLRADRGRDR